MQFKRAPIEEWFDKYQYKIEYDIGGSGVKYLTFDDLDIDLKNLPLRYGYHKGKPELRELIAEQYESLSSDQIVITTGASEANFAVIASLVKPGDHVIVEHPNYAPNYEVPKFLGCDVSLLHLSFEKEFKPDLEEVESLMRPQTKLVSLTHPNNPTGSTISRKTLEGLIELVESHDSYLLFDETYLDLMFDDPLPPAASLSSKVISINTMSKSYRLPGIRIGWIAAKDKSIIESALAIREQLTICNSAISEEIALLILRKRSKFLDGVRQHVERNFKMVSEWMKDQDDLEWTPPEAGVVCFPRLKLDVSVDDFSRILMEKYKTFVVPGRCFEVDGHFRIGYGGTSEEVSIGLKNVDKALRNMKRTII